MMVNANMETMPVGTIGCGHPPSAKPGKEMARAAPENRRWTFYCACKDCPSEPGDPTCVAFREETNCKLLRKEGNDDI